MAQLGIVTYNIAKDWDLTTILARLEKLGYEGVELRTSHAHKVEVNLTKAEREAVRNRFEDSPVQLAGLGSAFEYQSADPADGSQEYRGDQGIRPTGTRRRFAGREGPAQRYPQEVRTSMPHSDRSAERSTRSARDATGFGVEIRVEVHGSVTSDLDNFAKIIEIRRPSQRLHLLELQSVRRQERLDQGDIRLGRAQSSRGTPPRPDRRNIPLARSLFALLKSPELPGLHARRDPRELRPGTRAALFPVLWIAYQPGR